MNFMNQLFEQLKSLFLGLTPGARVLSGVMIVAILVGSGLLVRDIQQSDMVHIFPGHVFKQSELDLAETALGTAGLTNYKRDGMRILVPKNQSDLYIKALADGKATPTQLGSATDRALSGANMLESMFMSKTRILDARQRDLASALESLPFVDKVYVTYDEKREGFSSQSKSTAAVFVLPRGNRPLEEQQKRSIMHHVRAAFAGLEYESISIMDGSSGLSMNGQTDPMNSEQQRYYQQKLQAEQRLKEKARNLLVDYGDVRIEANVELDTTIREETESVKYADKPVTIQTTTSKRDSESSRPVSGGRVGTDPNALATANRGQTLPTNEQKERNKEQQESERKIVGQETTLSEKVGLVIKNASLSVSLPMSYYSSAHRREWLELNPGTTVPKMEAADLKARKEGTQKKIQALLSNLLPFSPGEDTRPQIVVDDYLDVPVEEIPGPSLAATAGSWLASNWQSLAMFLLAGAVLMSVRSFVASGSKGSDDSAFDRGFDIPLDNAADIELAGISRSDLDAAGGGGEANESVEGESGSEAKDARSRFKPTGGDMRTELASLIQENPDVAASLLRDWIGEAA